MICPLSGSDLDWQQEDESADDVCEPFQSTSVRGFVELSARHRFLDKSRSSPAPRFCRQICVASHADAPRSCGWNGSSTHAVDSAAESRHLIAPAFESGTLPLACQGDGCPIVSACPTSGQTVASVQPPGTVAPGRFCGTSQIRKESSPVMTGRQDEDNRPTRLDVTMRKCTPSRSRRIPLESPIYHPTSGFRELLNRSVGVRTSTRTLPPTCLAQRAIVRRTPTPSPVSFLGLTFLLSVASGLLELSVLQIRDHVEHRVGWHSLMASRASPGWSP